MRSTGRPSRWVRAFTAIGSAVSKAIGREPSDLQAVNDRGWWPVMVERLGGEYQRDIEVNVDAVLAQATVFACITLIAADIGKLDLHLVQKDQGIWQETDSAAFSPVLRKPNRYQTRQQFVEQWITSKLSHGNAYILKERDGRGVVVGLYVLDPGRVQVLVAPDGSVYYRLREDNLSGLTEDDITAPASEVIHDRMNCLFHPLVGLSPIFASGLAATQALQIQSGSAKFFQNQSRPSGVLSAPKSISDETAKRIRDYWERNYQGSNKVGSVAVLGDDLKYTPMSVNAEDAQLVEQLKISAEQVCSTFHVPAYMVGAAPAPAYNNIEALNQQYYNQCLQALIEAAEACLDEGLGLSAGRIEGRRLGTQFDLDDLLRMDTATQIDTLNKAVGGGWLAPNEARARRGLGPVEGGETPYLQQQNYALAALAKRDQSGDPFGTAPAPAPEPAPDDGAAKTAAEALRIAKSADEAHAALEATIEARQQAEQQAAAETRELMQQLRTGFASMNLHDD